MMETKPILKEQRDEDHGAAKGGVDRAVGVDDPGNTASKSSNTGNGLPQGDDANPGLHNIPSELLAQVLAFLPTQDVLRLLLVCFVLFCVRVCF